MRAAGVGVVYLMHGTFAGSDAAGVLTAVGRLFPAARDSLAKLAKGVVDGLLKDNGNYTAEYAAAFERALNADGGPPIAVRTHTWSGQNHHLGRAHAAVALVDHLAALELPPGSRILVWCHSHAGNVAALLTNLVAGDDNAIDAFFRAARCYYRVPLVGVYDLPIWPAVEQLLRTGDRPIIKYPLDVVTFGTPIRYGWNLRGLNKLLHVVNHRTADDRAPYPRTIDEVLRAVGGDYVQHVGIAGTNTPPVPLSFRCWLADRRLHELLQPSGLSPLTLHDRIRLGCRVPDAGETLLVDYGPPDGAVGEHLAGHAVYTKLERLWWHADTVASQLYGSSWQPAAA
jgi:hypothetical protein